MTIDDPYKPPQSGLNDDPSAVIDGRAWPWKLYFFLNTGLTFLGLPSIIADPAAGSVDYFYLALIALSTVGLFGFAFNRAYLVPSFWRALLIVSLVYSLSYYFLTDIDLRMGMSTLEYRVSNVIAWLLVLPGYVALYLYGRAEDFVWRLKKVA